MAIGILSALAAALAIAAVVVFGAVLAGRALDHETAQYVTFTRDGATVECERITDVAGRTFYDSCRQVP